MQPTNSPTAQRSVLVTGAAKRIGKRIAMAFGQAGWHVVIHCNASQDAARELADGLPSAEVVACDLADGDAAAAMVEELARRLPDWRVLVNNASVFEEDAALTMDPAIAARAMQVNAITQMRLAQCFLTHARSTAGRRVIQVTDQKLGNVNPDFFSYSMSKFAVDGGARMLSMAAAPGDRVYRLAPGAILPSHDQSTAEAERSHLMNLLRRRTGSDEVAAAALFLAEGSLVTGSVLHVDSGQHLLSQPRDVIYLEREEDCE